MNDIQDTRIVPSNEGRPVSPRRNRLLIRLITVGVALVLAAIVGLAFLLGSSKNAERNIQNDPYTISYHLAGLAPFDKNDLSTYHPTAYFMWNGTMAGYKPLPDGTNLVEYFKHQGSDDMEYIESAQQVCSGFRSGNPEAIAYVHFLLHDKTMQTSYQFGKLALTTGQEMASAITLLFCPDQEYRFVRDGLPKRILAGWYYAH